MKIALFITLLVLRSSFAFCQECNLIEKKVDEFSDEITYSFKGFKSVRIICIQTKGENSYYLSLKTTGNTLNIGEKGTYIIFEDGKKLIREDAEIDAEFEPEHYYGSGNYEYGSFIRISQSDVEEITTNPIKKFKLFIYEKELTEKQRNDLKESAKCLLLMTKK